MASKKPFKLTNNRPQSAMKLTNNRPQSAIKVNRNSAKPNHAKIQKAQKSDATKSTSGGSFGKFVGQ